ncbi:MAG: hypothetical protein HC916_19900 [Coleofasciculaceae cyanobacterium SM2_1_6]|nr:hypothetical protein [Coleofasciculaceae cyanobacterium SM2_1_6]
MSFNSPFYALFLLIVAVIYWAIPAQIELRLLLILASSLIFYSSLQWYYIPLFLVITAINWQLGKSLTPPKSNSSTPANQNHQNHQRKKILLGLGIALNILVLVGFKYIPFFLGAIANLYQQFTGFPLEVTQNSSQWVMDNLVVPLGISFFTFESIAYLVDSFKGQVSSGSLLQFTAYKLFFPKFISGPITPYDDFYRQVKQQSPPQLYQLSEAVWLIAIGIIKKALLADRLGILVDLCFSNAERAGSVDLWLGIVAYGFQLYLDFSGYVNMARGECPALGL